jgi:hypothetical protein
VHLHQVRDHTDIANEYTIEGTPYTLTHVAYAGIFEVRRDGKTCRAETKEFRERFGVSSRNAKTAVQVSEWLQGVWTKRVQLALTIGEVP